MKIAAVVQARLGSTRFPQKVLKQIGDYRCIELLIKRLKLSKKINQIIIATTNNKIDDALSDYVKSLDVKVFRGSENNVLERYINASQKFKIENIVRITGDCPFVDADLVDNMVQFYFENEYDYVTNTLEPTFPDGLDVEIFSLKTLELSMNANPNEHDKEHVTPLLRKNKNFKKYNYRNDIDYSDLRWTLDQKEDLETLKKIFKLAGQKLDFNWHNLIISNPSEIINISKINSIIRNEGMNMSTGQKLYKRAKNVIPGGTMLLSKRPEMFLPNQWPSYFSKAKGCKVWDLDNKMYLDMSIMGVGTNTLGYGNDEVDKAVKEVLNKGNMSTFNCPEEVLLAEKLIEIEPWADMVRFARTGGEANSIAIRLARAASGKDNVAICGYHGWHDWYLSANIGETDQLGKHLLPGLKTSGVPKNLKDSVFTFNYNNFEELKFLIKHKNIGVIKMEVERNKVPENDFLLKIREVATQNNIVLIFDECTSGFRETYGGLAKKYNVEPDISIFGKALGNGYAITAVVGKREIMEVAQNTFVSSTFWTERIGPAAALKTLDVMARTRSWDIISKIGEGIKKNWKSLATTHKIQIETSGLKSLPSFTFKNNNLENKTFITQEMLKKGFLAATSVYVCVEHIDNIIENYFNELDSIFIKIKKCDDEENILNFLTSSVSHSGFSRLN